LESGVVGVFGGRKTGKPREKPSEQGKKQQHTQPTYGTRPELNPGQHWWEASALTGVPSLLLCSQTKRIEDLSCIMIEKKFPSVFMFVDTFWL